MDNTGEGYSLVSLRITFFSFSSSVLSNDQLEYVPLEISSLIPYDEG